jgi:hypothetical protein
LAPKNKDGLPRRSFAYAPTDDPSTWKLPYLTASGDPDPAHLGGAVAALSEGGFRGQQADIPADALPAVKAKLRQAYKRAGNEVPASLREADDGDDEAEDDDEVLDPVEDTAEATPDDPDVEEPTEDAEPIVARDFEEAGVETLSQLAEAKGDDHYYGGWKGGKASSGGHPVGGGGGGKGDSKDKGAAAKSEKDSPAKGDYATHDANGRALIHPGKDGQLMLGDRPLVHNEGMLGHPDRNLSATTHADIDQHTTHLLTQAGNPVNADRMRVGDVITHAGPDGKLYGGRVEEKMGDVLTVRHPSGAVHNVYAPSTDKYGPKTTVMHHGGAFAKKGSEADSARAMPAGGRFAIKAKAYRGQEGFLIYGKDAYGRNISIHTTSRASADRIKAKLKNGEEISLKDFAHPGAPKMPTNGRGGLSGRHADRRNEGDLKTVYDRRGIGHTVRGEQKFDRKGLRIYESAETAAADETFREAFGDAADVTAVLLEEVGKRNSSTDLSMIQKVHDLTAQLGADCAPADGEAAAAVAEAEAILTEAAIEYTGEGALVTIVESGYEPAYGPAAFVSLREAGAVFDDATKSVWITPIRPGFGNKRDSFYYPAGPLREAVEAGKFNGRKMYVNHPTKSGETERPERDLRDWVATVRESVWDGKNNRPRARVHVVDDWAYERWKAAPEDIAFSIIGGGSARPGRVDGRDARIVESLDQIRSVDWVTEAGAGGALEFAESAAEEHDVKITDLTAAQIAALTPEQMRELIADAAGAKAAGDKAADDKGDKASDKAADKPEKKDDDEKPPAYVLALQKEIEDLKRAGVASDQARTREAAVTTAKAAAQVIAEAAMTESVLPKAVKQHVLATFKEATVGDGMAYADEGTLKAAVARELSRVAGLAADLTGDRSLVKGLGTPPGETVANPMREAVATRMAARFGDNSDAIREAKSSAARYATDAGEAGDPVAVGAGSQGVAARMAEKL